MQLLEDAGIRTTGQRGYHLLWHAAQSGVICIGPMEGKQQTFVLLEEWVPHPTPLSRGEALAELARRYFTSHGPATAHDFAWWTGLTVTEARKGLALAAANLTSLYVDGVEHWTGKKAVRRGVPGPLLLPGFDEYLLGYKNRSAVLPARHAARIVPGSNGMFLPTMVLDGHVVGTWKRTVTAKSVAVVLTPFDDVSDALDRFAAEAERYAMFIRLPLASVTVSTASVGS